MRRPKMFSVLPTLLTLANAASGFGAITFAARVGPEHAYGNHLLIAAILIFVAMVFDMLDGTAARWMKQQSDFGAELDSLCDAVSFGVAPAFLMLQFVRYDHTFGGQMTPPFDPNIFPPRLLWVIAVLFTVCALLRLARFNVETEEDDSHDYFSGLPSPAAAGMVASFPIAMHGLRDWALDPNAAGQHVAEWLIAGVNVLVPLITLAVACLMVSRLRYAHVFNQLMRGQKSRQTIIQIVFALAAIFVVREMAVPLIFGYFAFSAPVRAFWTEVIARRLYKSSEMRQT